MKRFTRSALALLDGLFLILAWPLFLLLVLTSPSWLAGLLQWWKS